MCRFKATTSYWTSLCCQSVKPALSRVFFVMLLLSCGRSALVEAAPNNKSTLELAHEYIRVSKIRQALEIALENLAPHALPQSERDPAHLLSLHIALASAEQKYLPAAEENLAQIYAQEYTAEQLRAAIKFFSSADGRAFAAKAGGGFDGAYDIFLEIKDDVLSYALDQYCQSPSVICHNRVPGSGAL